MYVFSSARRKPNDMPMNQNNCSSSSIKEDRVSNLPLEVTELILQYLPFIDAARTSILSRQWRYTWVRIPQLILDQDFFDSISKKFSRVSTYANAINTILSRLDGPIRKFTLYVPTYFTDEALDQWLTIVSNKGVKEIELVYSTRFGGRKKLPSSLFSCKALTHLTLVDCNILYLPWSFQCFPCLVNLELEFNIRPDFCLMATVLEDLIFNHCPELESLSLTGSCSGIGHSRIRDPTLEDLMTVSIDPFSCISFEGAKNIKRLYLVLPWLYRMQNISTCFPNVEKLTLSYHYFPRHLAGQEPPQRLTNELRQLTTLKLGSLPLNCHFVLSVIFNLFQNSPQLKHLNIYSTPAICKLCRGQYQMHYFIYLYILQSIKTVQLLWISGSRFDLEFIKFLLVGTPLLETMTIHIDDNLEGNKEELLRVVKELKQIPCASENAKIIVKTNHNDIFDC